MTDVVEKYRAMGSRIVQMLERHEGLRLKTYKCSNGFDSIGLGRNLIHNPLTYIEKRQLQANGVDTDNIESMVLSGKDDAYYLLDNDLQFTVAQLQKRIPYWGQLSVPRQDALVDMAFQMGVAGLLGFERMFIALEAAVEETGNYDYSDVVHEMLDSKWAREFGKQEGDRPYTLSQIMLTDTHYSFE